MAVTEMFENHTPPYVIMIDDMPYTADQDRIRTYKTVAKAEQEITRILKRYPFTYSNKKIAIGEFIALIVKEIRP